MKSRKTTSTIIFDLFEIVDRALYGFRMRLCVFLSLIVLVFGPVLDRLFDKKEDEITYWSTVVLIFMQFIFFLTFISSLRDDTGKVTARRIIYRIRTYISN